MIGEIVKAHMMTIAASRRENFEARNLGAHFTCELLGLSTRSYEERKGRSESYILCFRDFRGRIWKLF